jgi:hypothetical protein
MQFSKGRKSVLQPLLLKEIVWMEGGFHSAEQLDNLISTSLTTFFLYFSQLMVSQKNNKTTLLVLLTYLSSMVSDLFQLVVSPEISRPNNEADMELEVKVHTLPPDKALPVFISHFYVLLDIWLLQDSFA